MGLKFLALHLGFDVFGCETLSDYVDALGVSQDVSSALRAVHQGLQAADQRRVDLRLGRLVVHRLQEVQDAGEAVQLDEPGHEAAGEKTRQVGE